MENPLDDIEQVERIADPAERAREVGRRLAEIPTWQERLKAVRRAAVLELRADRYSFAQIGEMLSLHRNRVQQIAEGRSGGGQGGGTKKAAGPAVESTAPAKRTRKAAK